MVSLAPKSAKLFKFNPFLKYRLSYIFPSRFQLSTLQNAFYLRRTQSTLVSPTDDSKVTEKDTALARLYRIFQGTSVKNRGCRCSASLVLDEPCYIHRLIEAGSGSWCGRITKVTLRLWGRMVEIYGQEASGKTTLALHVIREAQKLGGCCAYLDVENAMCPAFAESIGVNTDNLLVSQPDCAENLLSVVDTLTKSGSVAVIVVDSVAALVPQFEVAGVKCGSYRDLQAKIMTQALRKIHYSQCHSSTLIIFINQIRKYPKLVQGSSRWEEATCGGNALRFYAAMRLRISRKELLKTGDKATGLGICVQVVKNKLAPAMAKAELGIKFGKGIWRESEALDLGCEHGVIVQDSGCYFIGCQILRSRDEALEYLASNDEALDDIVKTLRCHLFERQIA